MTFGTTVIEYGFNAVIASSGTTSAAVDLKNLQLLGVIIPSAVTGTAFTLTMSKEIAGTYVTVQDGEGADYSPAMAASKYIPITPLPLSRGLRFIKIVSNASEAAQRTFTLVCGEV